MYDWHDSSCRKPDIVMIDGLGIPSCQSCGKTGFLEGGGGSTTTGTGLRIPQSDPSKLCLKWPSSINFIDPGEETGVPAQEPTAQAQNSLSAPQSSTSSYQALQGRQIRVLELSPGKPEDAIHIHLVTTTILDLHGYRYEALSYTWANAQGDSGKTSTIYVGDRWRILKVTENCANALRRLRLCSHSRDLWVDAICINQDDMNERTQQVAFMQEIYACAGRVLIYLGEGDVAKLEHLYQRPYFSRVWVIQEIEAARSAQVLWGSRSLSWPEFHAHAKKFCAPWVKHFDRRRIRSDMDLFYLLLDTVGCKMSDPRDRVFALLGLVPHHGLDGLVPDYSLSLPAVHIGITAHFLTRGQNLRKRILHSAISKKLDNLPSWVPNWSAPLLTVREKPPGLAMKSWARICIGAWTGPWTVSVNRNTGALWFQGVQLFLNYGVTQDGHTVLYHTNTIEQRSRHLVTTHLIQSNDIVCKSPDIGFALVIRRIKTTGKTLTGRLVGVCTISMPWDLATPSTYLKLPDAAGQRFGFPLVGDAIFAAAEAARSVFIKLQTTRVRFLFCKAIIRHALNSCPPSKSELQTNAHRRALQIVAFWTLEATRSWVRGLRANAYYQSVESRWQQVVSVLEKIREPRTDVSAPGERSGEEVKPMTIASEEDELLQLALDKLQGWDDSSALHIYGADDDRIKDATQITKRHRNVAHHLQSRQELGWVARSNVWQEELEVVESRFKRFLRTMVQQGLQLQREEVWSQKETEEGFTEFEIV